LQQSATEQELMSRIERQRNERKDAAAAKAAAVNAEDDIGMASTKPSLISAAQPLQVGGLTSDLKREAIRTIDPLGVNNIDLLSAEAARFKGDGPGSSNTGGSIQGNQRGGAAGASGGSLLAAKERINLLQKLQQAPFGGGSVTKGKYTRNRNRAIEASAGANSQAMAGVSIVPQDENFDPLLFLTIVHGASSFEDLKRGQQNLEKAMGSQENQLQELVNEHYESFVRCADGIHWFKNMIAEEFISNGKSYACSPVFEILFLWLMKSM